MEARYAEKEAEKRAKEAAKLEKLERKAEKAAKRAASALNVETAQSPLTRIAPTVRGFSSRM